MKTSILQQSLVLIKQEITFLEDLQKDLVIYSKDLYNQCDVNDAGTLEAFQSLNTIRNQIRKYKSKIKTLSDSSRYIKKQLRA